MTVNELAAKLQAEMSKLTFTELKVFATKMGVRCIGLNRREIEDECLALEQYAFTHEELRGPHHVSKLLTTSSRHAPSVVSTTPTGS